MAEIGATSPLTHASAKDRSPPIALKNSAMDAGRVGIRPTVAKRVVCVSRLAGGDRPRSGDDFGQLAKVLGDGGEVEFIAGAIRAAQP
jgi:hypothetical protein